MGPGIVGPVKQQSRYRSASVEAPVLEKGLGEVCARVNAATRSRDRSLRSKLGPVAMRAVIRSRHAALGGNEPLVDLSTLDRRELTRLARELGTALDSKREADK